MFRRILTLFSVVALALVLAAPAEAQFARAGVGGTVTDPDGASLPGVTVTALDEASGFSRTGVTTVDGGFTFNGLQPGVYTLTFELQGFRTIERSGIKLTVGQTTELNITLELGSVEETITVTAQSPMVEVTSKEVGGAIDTEEFRDLPSINHSFVNFAALVPGVIARPSSSSTAADALFVNGQDDNNNSFNVDGANNEDDVIGARAGAQVRTAIEAIQEFQILTTQFDAEFGRTTGGVLNAITKSGGNEYHGNGFFYNQDSDLNDRNFFTIRNNLPQADETFKQEGYAIGGPFVKDTAHWFTSLERSTPNEGISRNFESRPELSFTTSEANLLRNWVLKADVLVTPDNKAAVRYLREFSPQFNQIIGSRTTQEASREENDHDDTVVGTLDTVFTDTTFNNIRASFTREDVSF
ncbi:MAG: carboxypeptidase regulatory-like domain-containing protein, partial [Acidobacteriota bacterium]